MAEAEGRIKQDRPPAGLTSRARIRRLGLLGRGPSTAVALACVLGASLLIGWGVADAGARTAQAAAGTASISDAFNRSVSRGWGTADVGGSYTYDDPEAFSVNGKQGVIKLPGPGRSRTTKMPVSSMNQTATVSLGIARLPSSGNGVSIALLSRDGGGKAYRAAVRIAPGGKTSLELVRVDGSASSLTALKSVSLPYAIKANSMVNLELATTGTSNVDITARAWPQGTSAPTAQVTYRDTSAKRITSSGLTGIWAYSPGSSQAATIVVDNLKVTDPGSSTTASATPTSTTSPPSSSTPPTTTTTATTTSSASPTSTPTTATATSATPTTTSAATTQSSSSTCPTGQLGTPPNCYPTPPAPLAAGKQWKMLFNDEFNGTTLNTANFTPCFDWNSGDCTDTFNNGREHYDPGQVQVSGGTAKLVAQPLNPPLSSSSCYQGSCTYKAGLISTARPRADVGSAYLHPFTYGYIESRLKYPAVSGMFTAFWMLPTDPSYSYRNEIDIAEILGGDPDTIFMTYHYNNRNTPYPINAADHKNGACATKDYSTDFVRLGMDWEPTYVAWYIDGVKCGQFNGDSTTIENGPMQIILHMMVDNNWERSWGLTLANQSITSQLEVDYLRVYQQN